MNWLNCIYCNHNKLYHLQNGYLKCSLCKKKFSPKKVEKKHNIINCFIDDLTIRQCAQKLELSYMSVSKYYKEFRVKIATYLEDAYLKKEYSVSEYDEYLYLEKTKKHDKKYIFDSKNFLTFDYEDKIYNILMPPLDRYKDQFIDDNLEDVYHQEFSKFLLIHKVAKLQQHENNITKFWYYFERFILKYKGINQENFFYYLKEAEFKYNYTKQEQKKILTNL